MNRNCGSLCRCMDCNNRNNFMNNENIDINKNDNIMKNNLKGDDDYNDDIEFLKEVSKSYNINAFGILIQDKHLILQDRNVDLNSNEINLNTTPKLTNKKRSRIRNENSNVRTCPTTNNSSRRRRKNYTQVNTNVKTKKLNL